MHKMFADWYAKADREPSQKRLQSRSAGVESFGDEADLDTLLGLLRYLGGGNGDETASSALQEKLKQEDATFLLRDNDLELRVLSAISLILMINSDSSTSTAVALAVDVAAALGTEEVGPLGRDLVETAQRHLMEEGRRLRVEPDAAVAKRSKQPALDAGDFSLPQEGTDVAQVQTNAAGLAEYVVKLNTAIKSLGAPLRALAVTQDILAASTAFNAVLAEESSMLWWLVGEHSRDLEVPLASLARDSVCLVAGKDLADLTRIIPGPLSVRAMIHKALDSVGVDPTGELELGQVVDAVDRHLRRRWLGGRDLTRLRGIGRCLPALAASIEVDDDVDWRQLVKSRDGILPETRLSQLDWARLCYSECLLLRQDEDRDD